ncbi:MAG: hypothetical protein QW783_02520 [Candidatus Micrarchaeia archaeon]
MTFSEIPTCLGTCTLSSDYLNWMPTIGALIFIVLLALAIGFMISRFLNRRDWEAMVRLELYHLSVAVIWISIIAIVANLTCSLSCSITNDESPFTSAINYAGRVSNQIADISQGLYNKAKEIRIYSAEVKDYEALFYSPLVGCNEVANVYENFAVLLTPFVASLMIQQYALIFISIIAFQYLLPIGIVLRIIPGMKDTAAYIIGIAFAFYIVFPLTYIIAEKSTEGFVTSRISTEFDSTCLQVSEMREIMQNIGLILPQAVFFPALSSIITIASARALSEIFKYDFAELKGE